MNETVRDFFNNIAVNYVHNDNKMIDELLESLFLQKAHKVLDLGCGKGIITDKLATLSKGEVVALDISEKMIEYAKENVKSKNVTLVNVDFYGYNSSSFDAIICFDAYPHFLDVEGFVNKCNELLTKNGVLAIIHDIGRPTLNKHHESHAENVSRLLKEPKEEVKPFLKYFTPIELSESDTFYKMVLIKK